MNMQQQNGTVSERERERESVKRPSSQPESHTQVTTHHKHRNRKIWNSVYSPFGEFSNHHISKVSTILKSITVSARILYNYLMLLLAQCCVMCLQTLHHWDRA